MFSILPWRFSALVLLLCLLGIPSAPLLAQIVDSDTSEEQVDDVDEGDESINIIVGITPVPQPNCHFIGFCVEISEPFIGRFRWTFTDLNGNLTFQTTSSSQPCVTVPVPVANVSVRAQQSFGSFFLTIGTASASIPSLGTFTLTPDFRSILTDNAGFEVGLTFTGNRCFEASNIFAYFLPGSDPAVVNTQTTVSPTTFGTTVSLRFRAQGASIGTNNFYFVTVNPSVPNGPSATAVYQVRVTGCCIGSERPEEQMMSDAGLGKAEIIGDPIVFTEEERAFYEIDRLKEALGRGEPMPQELRDRLNARFENPDLSLTTAEMSDLSQSGRSDGQLALQCHSGNGSDPKRWRPGGLPDYGKRQRRADR